MKVAKIVLGSLSSCALTAKPIELESKVNAYALKGLMMILFYVQVVGQLFIIVCHVNCKTCFGA
jgi:hypothetical protein